MKIPMSIRQLTPYQDVNDILEFFVEGAIGIFQGNLTGIYLTGSLSYQAFDYKSSDIDITVILQNPVSSNELDAIRHFHVQLEDKFNQWASRLECTYTPVDMLSNKLPPTHPRPWYWGGEHRLYAEALYGNEWIINNYLLYQHAIALVGPDFKELTSPIDIEEVQKACIRDLFKEWEPKKTNPDWFKDSHNEAYLILNLCRILYTVMCKSAGSKQIAASWVMSEYGEPWSELIRAAGRWQAGMELNVREQAIRFVDFVIGEVSTTALYNGIADEMKTHRV
jgi:hypothetical protein